jgi:hypothetical protein
VTGVRGRAFAGALAVTSLLGFGAGPAPGAAQRFTVELAAGPAVGNYSETGAGLELEAGPAFTALVEARLQESITGYIGFTRSSFGCVEGFCIDRDVTLTSQGVVLGGRWAPGLPWVRAGVTVQALDVDAVGASESADAGFGWDLGAGLDIRVHGPIRVRPGLTYPHHGASTDLGDGHVAIFAFQLGVAVRLGS